MTLHKQTRVLCPFDDCAVSASCFANLYIHLHAKHPTFESYCDAIEFESEFDDDIQSYTDDVFLKENFDTHVVNLNSMIKKTINTNYSGKVFIACITDTVCLDEAERTVLKDLNLLLNADWHSEIFLKDISSPYYLNKYCIYVCGMVEPKEIIPGNKKFGYFVPIEKTIASIPVKKLQHVIF